MSTPRRPLEEGRPLIEPSQRSQREVANYLAGLRYIDKRAFKKNLTHQHIFKLHRILADGVIDQRDAGRYRHIAVRVGRHVPPHPDAVSGLMFELLQWWNTKAPALSPILSAGILHYRFEAIHPFADGNSRAGRALAL